MGFLSRLRDGLGAYGDPKVVSATTTLASDGQAPIADSVPTSEPAPGRLAGTEPAPRGPRDRLLVGPQARTDRTTTAERAFMDLRRGSNV
jgi:hypothetical protein